MALLMLAVLLTMADYLAAQDPTSSGEVSAVVLVAGLREVVQAALPWDSFVHDLANVDAAGRVRYQTFLARYRVESSDTAWQGRVLASLYAKLCEKDLSGTLAFFDTNLDGQVTTVELTQASSVAARSRPLALPAAYGHRPASHGPQPASHSPHARGLAGAPEVRLRAIDGAVRGLRLTAATGPGLSQDDAAARQLPSQVQGIFRVRAGATADACVGEGVARHGALPPPAAPALPPPPRPYLPGTSAAWLHPSTPRHTSTRACARTHRQLQICFHSTTLPVPSCR